MFDFPLGEIMSKVELKNKKNYLHLVKIYLFIRFIYKDEIRQEKG